MGILPEIERVWFAIDQQLVLWDYVDGYTYLPTLFEHWLTVIMQAGT
jgi:hypothetical protein